MHVQANSTDFYLQVQTMPNRPSKKLSKKYYKIIFQPGILLFTLCFLEFMYSIYPIFHMFKLEHIISNSFPKRIQLVPIPVIIDGEPEYKISWIADSKIDCWWICKLLYKMIWLRYEDIKNNSEWISVSKLTYTADLISDFYITYSTKPGLLLLFWSCCCTYFLSLYTSNGDYYYYFPSIFYLLVLFNPISIFSL